jgi:hypothetical protein
MDRIKLSLYVLAPSNPGRPARLIIKVIGSAVIAPAPPAVAIKFGMCYLVKGPLSTQMKNVTC